MRLDLLDFVNGEPRVEVWTPLTKKRVDELVERGFVEYTKNQKLLRAKLTERGERELKG